MGGANVTRCGSFEEQQDAGRTRFQINIACSFSASSWQSRRATGLVRRKETGHLRPDRAYVCMAPGPLLKPLRESSLTFLHEVKRFSD